MIDLATFVINPSGRIEVMLGRQLCGVIEPWDGPQLRSGMGRIGAYCYTSLPVDGGAGQKLPATSVQAARHLILRKMAHWFDAAGPLFQMIAEALANQAQQEREAAMAPSLFRR